MFAVVSKVETLDINSYGTLEEVEKRSKFLKILLF